MQKREQLERMKKQTQAYRELVARNSIKQGYHTHKLETIKRSQCLVSPSAAKQISCVVTA